MEQLGGHIKTWRIVLELSQKSLADQAGVSVPALRRLESGEPGVKLDTLLRVVRTLHLDKNLLNSVDPALHVLGRSHVNATDIPPEEDIPDMEVTHHSVRPQDPCLS